MKLAKIWTEISEERLAGNFAALGRILVPRPEGSSHAPQNLGAPGLDVETGDFSNRATAVRAPEDGAAEDGAGLPISLLAVVKANAYGHGIDPCAAVLALAGAEWLGVTDAHEGAAVRAALAAPSKPTSQNRDVGHPECRAAEGTEILVMSGTAGLADEAECIVRERLTAVVWDRGHIERLAEAVRYSSGPSAGASAPVRVHLEVDAGMSRQGVAPGKALDAALRAIAEEPTIEMDGVMTHFASTEVAGSAQTLAQMQQFEAAVAQVAASGLRPRWMHVGNSSYIDNAEAGSDHEGGDTDSLSWLRSVARRLGARPMVRSGLALYGYLLPIEGPGRSLAKESVLPVMAWKTRVIALREIAAGALVGYNGTFVAPGTMRLALLPVGYADGLRRELSSTNERAGGWVIIRGRRAPIVGRVSMNLTTVDVTGVEGVMEGDEVLLLGDGVSAEDHARIAGTIPYEIVCGVKTSE